LSSTKLHRGQRHEITNHTKKQGGQCKNKTYKTYKISLIGCDNETEFNMKLTKEQAVLLGVVASKSEETSEYPCMPVMEIELLGDEELPF